MVCTDPSTPQATRWSTMIRAGDSLSISAAFVRRIGRRAFATSDGRTRMKLTLTMFLSVDGVYQAPGERGEDRSDGFDQGGWQVPYVDDDMMQLIGEWFA